jgi:hypothetical protein
MFYYFILFFPSLLAIETLQNHFYFWNFLVVPFFGEITPIKNQRWADDSLSGDVPGHLGATVNQQHPPVDETQLSYYLVSSW